jgi:hypothetical protein
MGFKINCIADTKSYLIIDWFMTYLLETSKHARALQRKSTKIIYKRTFCHAWANNLSSPLLSACPLK